MKNIVILMFVLLTGLVSTAYGKVVVLDVRTPQEYKGEHLPNAINIDALNSNFKTEVSKLNRDDDYKVYCRSGNRSGKAILIMKELGFKNLQNWGGLEDAKKQLDKNPH